MLPICGKCGEKIGGLTYTWYEGEPHHYHCAPSYTMMQNVVTDKDKIRILEARIEALEKQIRYHANTEYGATPYQLKRLLEDKQ